MRTADPNKSVREEVGLAGVTLGMGKHIQPRGGWRTRGTAGEDDGSNMFCSTTELCFVFLEGARPGNHVGIPHGEGRGLVKTRLGRESHLSHPGSDRSRSALVGCVFFPGVKGTSRLVLIPRVRPGPKSICFGNAYFEGRICGTD